MYATIWKNVYRASTGLLALAMLGAGVQDLRHAPELVEAIHRLGYPEYLLSILGVAKLTGAALLCVPRFPHLREWVYAGFACDFGGAIVSHLVSGDTVAQTLPALACALLLAVSYAAYRLHAPLARRLGGA